MEELTPAEQAELSSQLAYNLAELSSIESQISALSSQRDAISSSISSIRAQISPLRRLPQEVLAEIFFRCLPSTGRFPAMSATEAPVLLGRVCSSWRTLAYNTPVIWDSLHVVIPRLADDAARFAEAREQAVREWLGRAGARGLRVGIASGPMQGNVALVHPDAMPYVVRMMKVLMEFEGQWIRVCNTFQIDLIGRALEERLGPVVGDRRGSDETETGTLALGVPFGCPVLEEVQLASHRAATPEVFRLVNQYMFSPSLKRITLYGLQFDPLILRLPWSNLTHLLLVNSARHGVTQAGALELLRRCPKLAACSFAVTNTTPPPTSSNPFGTVTHEDNLFNPRPLSSETVFLPNLQALEVFTISNENVQYLFTHVSLPSLRHVSYRASPRQAHQNGEAPVPIPVTLLLDSTSTPPLESVSLNISQSRHQQIVSYLNSCVRLKRLQVTGVGMEPSLLMQLAPACRGAGVEEVYLDVFATPRPSPATILSSSNMEIDTDAIIGFVDTLYQPSTPREPDPEPELRQVRIRKITLVMKASLPRNQEAELEAYAADIRARTNGAVSLAFHFTPQRVYRKASPWDGVSLQEKEESVWFDWYC